jgi:hypothetical protein
MQSSTEGFILSRYPLPNPPHKGEGKFERPSRKGEGESRHVRSSEEDLPGQ